MINKVKRGRTGFVAALVSAFMLHGAVAEKHPNIIYIICDDLGYGEIQCLNPERSKVQTPHVDRLASQGMVSGSSVCTRLQSGVVHHKGQPMIAADRLTVPALLKKSGYYSACIGKWHLTYSFVDEAEARQILRRRDTFQPLDGPARTWSACMRSAPKTRRLSTIWKQRMI